MKGHNMPNETTATTTGEDTSTPLDTNDFAAYQRLMKDPDAAAKATELWSKQAASLSSSPATEDGFESTLDGEANTDNVPGSEEVVATGTETEEEDEDEVGEIVPEVDAVTGKPKKLSGYQKTILRLRAQVAALEVSKQTPVVATKEPVAAVELVKPTLAGCDYDEEKFATLLGEYTLAIDARKRTADEITTKHQQAINNFAASEVKARKELPDYDTTLQSVADLKFGAVAVYNLTHTEGIEPAVFAYEISKDRKLAERVATLSQSTNAADHLLLSNVMGQKAGQIIAKSKTSSATGTTPKTTPVISRAPEPGRPISGTAGASKRTAKDIVNEYASLSIVTSADVKKAERLATEYSKLTGKALI
jgi:hypothetical protein